MALVTVSTARARCRRSMAVSAATGMCIPRTQPAMAVLAAVARPVAVAATPEVPGKQTAEAGHAVVEAAFAPLASLVVPQAAA